MMSKMFILIPAAGASSRMRGRDKLLESVDGKPMLRLCAERALDTGAEVVVALSALRPDRFEALADMPVNIVEVTNAQEGMGVSISTAMASIGPGKPVMILPADMPELKAADLQKVMTAFSRDPTRIHRGASAQGKPGHPVIFPARLTEGLRILKGDEGAKKQLVAEEVRLCPLPDQHALTDLDSPEDWDAWRAKRS